MSFAFDGRLRTRARIGKTQQGLAVMKSIGVVVLALAMAGCASRASDIPAAYVSSVGYEGLSCERLREEATVVSSRAAAATGAQNQRAANDAVATGVSLILFWPAAFLVRGDGAQAAEVARLKGEMDAIEQASRRNECGIVFDRGPQAHATPVVGPT